MGQKPIIKGQPDRAPWIVRTCHVIRAEVDRQISIGLEITKNTEARLLEGKTKNGTRNRTNLTSQQ